MGDHVTPTTFGVSMRQPARLTVRQLARGNKGHNYLHGHPNLRPFDDDVLNMQTWKPPKKRINSTLDRLESLLNYTAIENVSHSAQDRIPTPANRPNSKDINKTLGKITLANYPTGKHPERNNPKRTNGRNEPLRSLLQVGKSPHACQQQRNHRASVITRGGKL